MAYIKTPVKGMSDALPRDARLRQYVKGIISETYQKFGFSEIETPCVEHIENLTGKQGGENEKLIFKIMKRGEKLDLTTENPDDLCDSGLRYDLTVPLSRYYACNANNLPVPFKALQIGNVWRAERPQKGRFRQFVQCDIDILGDPSCLAEIELISATLTTLGKLGFEGFTVRVNDRRLLKAMAALCSFPEDDYDKIFIILDKLDKIGVEGVKNELLACGYAEENIDKYVSMFKDINENTDVSEYAERNSLSDGVAADAIKNIADILDCVKVNISDAVSCKLVFDPSLVRGMSYYTGTIFEIGMDGYSFSVAGGGRYDEMIGRFSGHKVPACGFSIGFERIVTILKDKGFEVPSSGGKYAVLVSKNSDKQTMLNAFSKASSLREEGNTVLLTSRQKNVKFQKDQLLSEGYTEFIEF